MKILLYEPETFGHRLTYLKHITQILKKKNIPFLVINESIKVELLKSLSDIALQNNCNIIHILTIDGLFFEIAKSSLYFLRRKTRLKVVGNYYLYNNLYESPKAIFWNSLFLTQSIDKLFISDEFIDRRRYSDWKRNFLKYVPDTWNPEDFDLVPKLVARSILNIPPDIKVFLMFGDLSLRKGLNFFIESLLKTYSRGSTSFLGLIAGTLSDEVKRSDLFNKIKFLEHQSKLIVRDEFIQEDLMPLFFCSSDIVVCPYPKYFKVSSGTFTHACAAGVPSIVPSHSNLARIVESLDVGYTFEAESVDSLASTMENILKNTVTPNGSPSLKLQQYAKSRTTKEYGKILLEAYSEISLSNLR